jgi:hypothetical protein
MHKSLSVSLLISWESRLEKQQLIPYFKYRLSQTPKNIYKSFPTIQKSHVISYFQNSNFCGVVSMSYVQCTVVCLETRLSQIEIASNIYYRLTKGRAYSSFQKTFLKICLRPKPPCISSYRSI